MNLNNLLKQILVAVLLISMTACSFSDKKINDDRGYIVKVGDRAPDFSMKLIDGKTIRLSELRGKVVMLQFTASWCGVCRKEMPFIEEEIWQVHKGKDFALVGIDREEPLEKILKLVETTGVTYPVAFDTDGEIFQLFAKEKAGITRNVIIDRNGKIVFLTRLFERKEFNEMKRIISSLLEK